MRRFGFWANRVASLRQLLRLYLCLGVGLFCISWLMDLVPYPAWAMRIMNSTTLTPAIAAASVEKWILSTTSVVLALVSLVYATSRDSSLAIVASKSPRLSHFSVAFLTALAFGFSVWLRSTFNRTGYDVLIGCGFLTAILLWALGQGCLFVYEYVRMSSAQALDASLLRILRITNRYLPQARSTESTALEADRLRLEFGVAYQALSQLARSGIEGKSYSQCVTDVSKMASYVMISLLDQRLRGNLEFHEYNASLNALIRESVKHVLSLTDTFHEFEAETAISHCVQLVELGAGATDHPECLVACMDLIQGALLVSEKRGARTTVTGILAELDRRRDKIGSSQEAACALLLVYRSLLIEAILAGDSAVINEALYKTILTTGLVGETHHDLVRWVYVNLWVAALKGIEYSAYPGTDAFIKTFTSRFDQRMARVTLEAIIAIYAESGSVPSGTHTWGTR